MAYKKIVLVCLLFPLNVFSAGLCSNIYNALFGSSQSVPVNVEPLYTEEQILSTVDQTITYQDRSNKKWTEDRQCLCCHTTLPYSLNRAYDSTSKANFDKMIQLTTTNVQNNLSDPWYTSDHAGRNSKPTEAVVNSMTLVRHDINTGGNLSAVTQKSLEQIFTHMDSDGHIHWLDYKLEPFESKKGENWGNALAILTLEMAKHDLNYIVVNPKYSLLKQTLLSKAGQFNLNEKAVLLWANSFDNSVLPSATREQFIADITSKQNTDGSWGRNAVLGLGDNSCDVYSTAISLIGLISSGNKSSQGAIKAANWLMKHSELNTTTDTVSSFISTSMNRPNRPLNNGFATDVGTSYSALALKMYATAP